MKPLPLVILMALAGLAAPTLTATPASAGFACPAASQSASKPAFKTACDDAELVRLDKAADVALARALASADPLTALLLKRDQRWFADTLGNVDSLGIDGADGRERKRIADALMRRLAALEGIRSPGGELTGSWTNTFNDVTVESADGGALRVTIAPRAVYASADDVAGCSAKAELKREDDGWFSGAAINTTEGADAPVDNNPFKLRLRLQGNTLRVVLPHDEQDSFCARPEQLTGTYFAIGTLSATAPANVKAAAAVTPVKPSFDCATAKNLDEEEICADPVLAKADADIARAYGDLLKRVDATLAGHLRNDQRAWVKANPIAFDAQVNPAWNKESSHVHHTGNAREELALRLHERLEMLTNLDTARKGVAGFWLAHNAFVNILPDEEKKGGAMHASGIKWESGDYKSHCDFEADGRIVNGTFKTAGSFPDLARDGGTLVIGAKEREPPDYCSRMKTSKARLFPVKTGARIDTSDGRIR